MVVRVEMHYSRRRRSAGGWLEGTSPARLLPAIAKVKEDWGFWLGRKKRNKRCCSQWKHEGFAGPMAIIYRPNREDELAIGYRMSFGPKFN